MTKTRGEEGKKESFCGLQTAAKQKNKDIHLSWGSDMRTDAGRGRVTALPFLLVCLSLCSPVTRCKFKSCRKQAAKCNKTRSNIA